MIFYNNDHKRFYYHSLKKCKVQDTYHQSLFYVLGIDKDCRNHIDDLYDFDRNQIKLKGLEKAWHTSGSFQVSLLAFNLFNGYVDEKNIRQSTPYELFACEYSSFFIEAVKIRYPEYNRLIRSQTMEKQIW